MRAVEHREVLQLLAFVVPLEQALRDEARLVGDVGQRDDRGHRPGLPRAARSSLGNWRSLWAIEALASARISGVER